MSPYKIEIYFNGTYTEDKEPLYNIRIYDKDNNPIKSVCTDNKTKEYAIKAIAEYCGVTLNLAVV